MVTNPLGDVLCRGIDIHHIVEILVVKLIFDDTLDVSEISYHSILIECLGLAVNSNQPIVAVQVLTLALIRKHQIVRRRDAECFLDVIHI